MRERYSKPHRNHLFSLFHQFIKNEVNMAKVFNAGEIFEIGIQIEKMVTTSMLQQPPAQRMNR